MIDPPAGLAWVQPYRRAGQTGRIFSHLAPLRPGGWAAHRALCGSSPRSGFAHPSRLDPTVGYCGRCLKKAGLA